VGTAEGAVFIRGMPSLLGTVDVDLSEKFRADLRGSRPSRDLNPSKPFDHPCTTRRQIDRTVDIFM
jgi:hypothetical protein